MLFHLLPSLAPPPHDSTHTLFGAVVIATSSQAVFNAARSLSTYALSKSQQISLPLIVLPFVCAPLLAHIHLAAPHLASPSQTAYLAPASGSGLRTSPPLVAHGWRYWSGPILAV
ncbi:hypothetical protein DFH09DRAFT_1336836 [Mycena vulgaris]|nr:hypothetical protein DFH09DRAFT_1336836 [Mycena vulgaris]